MMIHCFGSGKTASGHNVDRYFYIFPKSSSQNDEREIGVLGGTVVAGKLEGNTFVNFINVKFRCL